MPSLVSFLRGYLRGTAARVVESEVTIDRGGESHPATVYRPARAGRLPGWVVLHGLTYTGREHPSLVRFARAIAAAGNVVLIPDIPEWRALRVAPGVTAATLLASVENLHDRDDVDADRVGLFGFSFGATQSLIAAARPEVQRLVRAIVAWGGYCDLRRLFVFGMVGEHELDGIRYHTPPDPYGQWVMAGNYLTAIPGHEEDGDIAAAVFALAQESGRRRIYAWDPVYDASKARLRATLPEAKRALFDLIARPSGAPPIDIDYARAKSLDLAEAALRTDPLMDPQPFLPEVRVRVLLAHARDDRLMPFTETIRLSRALPREWLHSCTITALFSHSGGTDHSLGAFGLIRESTRFATVLYRLLHMV
ncbi:MAG: hypothetical protein L0271_20520 [Gemmatimonadetes bacterium]|nr:hypothetical protein [Gemmatimonadota bacterium]